MSWVGRMGRAGRWLVGGILMLVAFVGGVWISGAIVLPHLMMSSADRWAVAVGVGAACAGFAVVWVQWWVGRADSGPDPLRAKDPPAPDDRSIVIEGGNAGIASTGDNTKNTQNTGGADCDSDSLPDGSPAAPGDPLPDGSTVAPANRSIAVKRDNTGIASTGDNTKNTQTK
jgi:hypothetical protein